MGKVKNRLMEQQVLKVFCFCSNLIPNFLHLYLSLSLSLPQFAHVSYWAWAALDVFIEFGDGLVTLLGTQVPYIYEQHCDD